MVNEDWFIEFLIFLTILCLIGAISFWLVP